ncbi:NUDIX hydrolase [Bacillus sp. FJAT-49736]|uniref:NUDIX domain-containing protein n=1 Tax=Bacillus sp. FJAT-49736 TaxID=2833582 RepID=UPI001BC9E2A6|nr:NUDIX hydrolase [Bacillus sp. FJAT-49736]MBS4174379.1 NUDIX hydrolase [Bacillus sp. FJAT-49736]
MLEKITELPNDKKIAGVHCIPIMDNGDIVMAWDKEEKVLTTIGGRLERKETLDEALDRELMEEVGLVAGKERHPIASWYWESTDTYTVWMLAKVDHFVPSAFDNEKTGYVIFNFATAREMVSLIDGGAGERLEILDMAEASFLQIKW